ncbi:MAG: serine/threonine-protein kinase, partial [Planctomycetota bacterium]
MASNQQSADQSDSDPTLASDGSDETQATPKGASGIPQASGREEATDKAGDQVGAYKLISKLGEGGFGTVWLAERRQPFVQQVALKIVKLGMDSKSVVARFEQERQALAVMNHPNVAKVLDGGLTPTGRPYFAMEYVKGEPITDYCDRQKLTIKERLELFTQVCEAVQHAHTKGIIHRDLKPGNILVASAEGSIGQAKVIDFGVAKALTKRMTEQTIFTETGQMIGSPSYMSPEQAEPDAND